MIRAQKMLKKLLIPVIFTVLTYGFWMSPNFKEIAAGVSVFLFGMLFLEEGFRAFTGGYLEKILKKTTDTFPKSLCFGIVSTTIMQSSSLVSVITISFLSAGLIGLGAGIGIIFGANLGTTTGAWLIAGLGLKVKISAYAMPMLVFGIILVFQKSKTLKGFGYILAGLGFLFLGIHYMKEGFEAFEGSINLAEFAVEGYAGLFLFTVIGIFATVVMQSSHATLVLIITALAAQQVTYENALALAIGANVGTTITAIIGSLSANYQGKRLAVAHLAFNVVTGLIAIIFIYQIIWLVEYVSLHIGIAHTDYTLKLAVFHTIFNLLGVIVMSPFVAQMVKTIERLMPAPKRDIVEPKYLNKASLDFPETISEAVRNEVIHLYDNAFEIMAHGINIHRHTIRSDDDLGQIIRSNRKVIEVEIDLFYESKVKVLYSAILEYISRAHSNLPANYAHSLYEMRQASIDIVSALKDIKHLRRNLVEYTTGDNDQIRDEYNDLRIQIATMLREVYELEQAAELDRDILSLDELKVAATQRTLDTNARIDGLIRDDKINAEMGTSLINDLGYTKDLIWKLAAIGSTLYGSKDVEYKEAEAMLQLDDEEIEILANS
jgi:phosphate:Na+ symporter